MNLPATDLDSRQAAGLLTAYGFTRNMFGSVQLWTRPSGAFLLRLSITADGQARLSLALRQERGDVYGDYRPWSVRLSRLPTLVAQEAVAFLGVIEGLHTPRYGGYAQPETVSIVSRSVGKTRQSI